jgi:DNA-binding CsgD family transcriptional regulator
MDTDYPYRVVLECLAVGAIIADHQGHLIYANSAARCLLERGVYTKDAARLTDHLRYRARRDGVERMTCGDGFVHAAFTTTGALTIVLIYSPPRDPARLGAALAEVYGLTPQERKLAIAIYDGLSLAEAAKLIEIEVSTARTHLKNIFTKTKTRRQASLALLIASCAAAAAMPQAAGAPERGLREPAFEYSA